MDENMDKRKHPRVETHIPIRYRKLRDGAGIKGTSSISNNLSQGGIRFRTAEFVSMACRMIVELDIPRLTKPIKAISKVAWIRKVGSENDFEMGNQFVEMSKKDKDIISEYVNSLNLSDSSATSAEQS